MTSPGVQNTLAEPNAGHERQVSKDTWATLTNDVVDASPDNHRRSRKRAVGDDGDDDQGQHDAKRFRVTAETSAAPPAATTTAESTGLPTAAAPQTVSVFTAAAPAAVDNHVDETSEPDEVLSEDEVNDAAPAQGDGRDTSPTTYDDEDPVLPTCVWTTLEPAALAYGIRPNYVDANRTPWRLTIIPPAPGRGAPNNVQVTSAGLPTCVWVRLGPKHFRYERKPEWADGDGCAWRLVLFPPPYTAAAPVSEDEDETSDDASSASEQVPFEECDCCCCCRGCWCCELATSDDELTTSADGLTTSDDGLTTSDEQLTTSDDAPSEVEWRSSTKLYTWTRLGPAFLGFDRYADVVDRNGVAWRRDLLPPTCTDVEEEEDDVSSEEDQASSPSDDGAQEAVQRSDADIDDDNEDAGATDAEDDGSDGGVKYDDEDELEYAD